ncbi:hypothetical protein C8R45DRAFT_1014114 [Mycena sanguinolenta]|nr:hypothetical protein C8R45DRAFT_1014114 [Mycena sanguinolenta]
MTTSPIVYPSAFEKDTAIDVTFGISTTVLTTLNSVAQSSPVAPAATICLAILTIASNIKANKESFRGLARDSCELVYAVVCQGDEARSPSFQSQVDHLVQVLDKIKKFSEKRAAKCFALRLLTICLDADKIKKYRAELEQRLKVFNLQSNVSIREMVEELLKRQKNQQGHATNPTLESRIVQRSFVVNGGSNNFSGMTFVNGDQTINQTTRGSQFFY